MREIGRDNLKKKIWERPRIKEIRFKETLGGQTTSPAEDGFQTFGVLGS